MAIEQLDIISGTLSIITVVIGTMIGLVIVSRYFKYKNISFLYWGIAITLLVCFLYAASISFVLAVFTGKGLSPGIYTFLATWSTPVVTLFLMAAFNEFAYKDRHKLLVFIVLIITI